MTLMTFMTQSVESYLCFKSFMLLTHSYESVQVMSQSGLTHTQIMSQRGLFLGLLEPFHLSIKGQLSSLLFQSISLRIVP